MSDYGTFSANSQNIKHFKLKQKARNLLIVFIIGVPILLGFAVYSYYRAVTNRNDRSEPEASTINRPQPENTNITPGTVPELPNGSQQLPGEVTNSNPNESSQALAVNTDNKVPSGVLTAINSIESNGVKNSPYIPPELDTSQIPAGTTIVFDKNSWTKYGQDQGSMNIKIHIQGITKNGTVTFGLTNGVWKVIGYGLMD